MNRFRRAILISCLIVLVLVSVPSSAETRTGPFDYGYSCGNFGIPVHGAPNYGNTCIADPQYASIPPIFVGSVTNPAVLARNGLLAVGGWDHFCGGCVGVPAVSGYLGGVYESGAISYFSAPAGSSANVSARVATSAVRADQFERNIKICLSVYEPVADTTHAIDCFGKGQSVRDLTVTFTTPSAPYGLQAKVTLTTSNDLGGALIRILDITVP